VIDLASGGKSRPVLLWRSEGTPFAAHWAKAGSQLSLRQFATAFLTVEHGRALNYAMQFAREMDADLADKFVACTSTIGRCYGERAGKSVKELITRGTRAGLLQAAGSRVSKRILRKNFVLFIFHPRDFLYQAVSLRAFSLRFLLLDVTRLDASSVNPLCH